MAQLRWYNRCRLRLLLTENTKKQDKMTAETFRYEMAMIQRSYGSRLIDDEWAYYQEWARRFPKNKRPQRYGILPQGASPSEDNMIYAADTPELRLKHLKCIIANGGGSQIVQFRTFLDKLEVLEGKKAPNYSSLL